MRRFVVVINSKQQVTSCSNGASRMQHKCMYKFLQHLTNESESCLANKYANKLYLYVYATQH